jgi:putative oxidoreductase
MNGESSCAKKDRFARATVGAARWVCGIVLLISGVGHLGNPYFFLSAVLHYDLAKGSGAVIVAATIPFVEIGLGGTLLVGACTGAALIATSVLMVVFTCAQAISLARGLEITCGCFGIHASEVIGPVSFARTIGLMVLATAGTAAVNWRQGGSQTNNAESIVSVE